MSQQLRVTFNYVHRDADNMLSTAPITVTGREDDRPAIQFEAERIGRLAVAGEFVDMTLRSIEALPYAVLTHGRDTREQQAMSDLAQRHSTRTDKTHGG